MKASELRKIVADLESVDNSDLVISKAKQAAENRKFSVNIDGSLITVATRNKLKELGYTVTGIADSDNNHRISW